MTETRDSVVDCRRKPLLVQERSGAERLFLLTRQVAHLALDLLFPPHCVHCDRVGSLLCPHCLRTVEAAAPRHVAGLDGVRAAVQYSGAVRSAIHAFKYEGVTRLLDTLEAWLCTALNAANWPVEMVTAVPLHTRRLRERGYNQAALLAEALAAWHGWDFAPRALSRTRETVSQVNLSARERRQNVAGAFVADSAVFSGRRVLVVDDVLTTGATLAACAEALRAAGASQVFGLTVAEAVFGGVDAESERRAVQRVV